MEEFLANHPWVLTIISLCVLVLAALFANNVFKSVLLRVLHRLLGRTAYGRDEEIRKHGLIERLANIVPAFVIFTGIAIVPGLPEAVVTIVRNVANAFIILTLAMAIGAMLNIVDTIYHRRPDARLKPIKGYLQVVSIAIYVIAALLIIATLIDRSPLILLSGLGAMAAVLILVFQDTLLSLVAGIQISSTDMVRVGDWIEMPAMNADGDVIEIALHTVKVQNFDKTITTIPIRKLVTDSFKNMRGMQESGGRRIKRSIHIDQSSIRFLEKEDMERLTELDLLRPYLETKVEEITRWNGKLNGSSAARLANTRRLTNIGCFRAYVQAYLSSNAGLHKGMMQMVRQLPPGPEGLPIEIYCFANTIVWTQYEAVQADMFDHLLAVLSEFDLTVFQNPSGSDFRSTVFRERIQATTLPA
ncbi:mechanosensitive ion channel family protein [Limoniibacter endophyticus]|uniref:mechanosensitive ion channel family protein n=1 Tax=Limoniibacter endophyticus TaxID=1565040 RepID=UPI00167B348B|nr:mechanosensitive ion channel family protein [Limoniibacter endophyticus]